MGGEKHGSKGGGRYVGGFLQLFDWNAKSRKKLFSSKSDVSEQSKQKKRSDGNLPTTQFNLTDEDELVGGSSIKGSSDYSRASSVTDEDGYGTKAPGVVARLMGLDSLPTSNLAEPFSTPFSKSLSLRDTHHHQRNNEFHREHQTIIEPKPQKTINRPIEKFQTEILPPKSAKSIPITRHKLLSPIKSPTFVPSNNPAHIMEAAAKIIDQGPQPIAKVKMPLVGPLKIGDLKEKVEASSSRRPVESNHTKFRNGSMGTPSFRVLSDSEDCSSFKNGKSISLALQAKVNVQRREGMGPSGSRKFGQKEQGEAVSSQTFRRQPNTQKSTRKKPAHNSSSVLRQNNQKQNCSNDKEKLPSKSLQNSQGRKVTGGDSSGRGKNSSKIGGNSKVGTEVTDSKKEVSYCGTKNVPSQKRSVDGNFHQDRILGVDSKSVDKTEKPIQSKSIPDRHFTWAQDGKRNGTDIVSFTFTAPLARSIPASEISTQVPRTDNGFCADGMGKKVLLNSDCSNSAKLCSVGYNMVGADALSVLLERKLRELMHGVESSFYREGTAGNSASLIQDLMPNCKAIPTTPMFHNKKNQDGIPTENLDGHCGSSFSSTDSRGTAKLKFQVTEDMDEGGNDDADTRKFLNYRHQSPISVLEPSLTSESCNSSDSADSNSTEGSKQSSSVQAQEWISMSSPKKFHLVPTDAELSDSASSTVTATRNKTHFVGSTRWELEYVKEILFNVELMFKDFALGRSREIINPHLFDKLETRKEVSESQGEKIKLRRRVIFDCVSECMDLRCRRYASGGCRTWAKGLSTLRRKEWLTDEVYKEILGWRGMGEFMVDDLVDKDMSTQYGKWVDFEVESFELGVEIEGRILNSLVNELVADILVH